MGKVNRAKLERYKMKSGWTKTTLRDVCLKTRQWKPRTEARESFYYIDVSAVSNDTFSITSPQTVTSRTAPGRARKIVRARDVIYATIRPTLNRVALVPSQYDDHIASTAFCVVRANKDRAEPEFLYFLLLSDEVSKAIAEAQHGASYPAVRDKDIFRQEVSIPPLHEQKKIAAVLLRIQRAIETQEKIIQSLRDLKKSTMQHLFTHGLRGEKTKMTEIGEIPEDWEIVRMSDLGKIITGTTPPTMRREFYSGGGYQFIAPADLGTEIQIRKSDKEITEAGLAVSRVLPKHAVCFVCIGSSIGKVGITVAEIAATNQQINAIVAYDDFDPFFIAFLLLHKSAYIAGHASPSPVPIMSKGKFSEIRIPVTRNNEVQEKIRNFLLGIEDKLECHLCKKDVFKDIFKTTLNKLMTGDIRVADLDIDVKEVAGAE